MKNTPTILQDTPIVPDPGRTGDYFGSPLEPPHTGFSFDAPGWYVVGGMVILMIVLFISIQIRRYLANKYRRHALQYLDMLENKWSYSRTRMIYPANVLVKRLMLRSHDRKAIASLTGEDWIRFLNENCARVRFDLSDLALIRAAVYQSSVQGREMEIDRFLDKVRLWIKKHKS